MNYGATGNQYNLESGYTQENNKIYQYADVQAGATQKYTDCDSEEGWC
ncbi:YusG family protein [Priestia flexa]|nr:YusG family protein [Priestia flexa]